MVKMLKLISELIPSASRDHVASSRATLEVMSLKAVSAWE
jgi:hypothetical protein